MIGSNEGRRFRRSIASFAVGMLAALALVSPSLAAGGLGLLLDERGAFLSGYDVVSYHEAGRPLRGQARYRVAHGGGFYWFATSENARRFAADPERYLPEYGGFCALGVSRGMLSQIDPLAYALRDGKLYFMINPATREVWTRRPDAISRADRVWPSLAAGL